MSEQPDLVELLREEIEFQGDCFRAKSTYPGCPGLLERSADEIERLRTALQSSGVEELLRSLREPTNAMLSAAEATPGMTAVNDAMVLHQARGYDFNGDAFKDGSPLRQAWCAMIDAALTNISITGENRDG